MSNKITQTKLNKTVWVSEKDIKRDWYYIDASKISLGRLASVIAQRLIGKNKPSYVENLDCGDYVIVLNVDNVKVTGQKEKYKQYARYSQYPGGLHFKTFTQIKEQNVSRIIESAVKGMLPRNKLSQLRMNRLYIYKGLEHKHEAQTPQELKY